MPHSTPAVGPVRMAHGSEADEESDQSMADFEVSITSLENKGQ